MKTTIAMILAAFMFSQVAAAAVIDQDWRIPGDAKLLFDTSTDMRWLDLGVTADMSHNAIVANLGAGGLFEGWRLATQTEVLELCWYHEYRGRLGYISIYGGK